MDGDLETLDLLRELEANGDLVTRLVVAVLDHARRSPEDDWAEFAPHRDEPGARWRAGTAKFFIDGVIDSGTGWLYEPDSRGRRPGAVLARPAALPRGGRATSPSRGFRCATHATGDRGVREALDAYRDAGAAPGVRHRIEHIETLQPHDLPRFAAEGVVASMQAQHMAWLEPDRSDNWSRRLGAERCDARVPDPLAARVRRRDLTRLRLAGGPLRPARAGWPAARLRRPPGERDRAPYDDQALDGLAALEGYTTGAAFVGGDEHRLGLHRARATAPT